MSAQTGLFIDGVYSPNTLTALYTAPASQGVRIERLTVTNQSASAATISIYIVPAGASATDAHRIIKADSIQAGKVKFYAEMCHSMRPGDAVRFIASASSALSVFMSGTIFR